jgi:hypothetical protein
MLFTRLVLSQLPLFNMPANAVCLVLRPQIREEDMFDEGHAAGKSLFVLCLSS